MRLCRKVNPEYTPNSHPFTLSGLLERVQDFGGHKNRHLLEAAVLLRSYSTRLKIAAETDSSLNRITDS